MDNDVRDGGGQPAQAHAKGLLDRVREAPGVEMARRAANTTLDAVGVVSPRTRRLVVYAGAGVLGAVGAVEWPVAATVAAVAWATQPRRRADQGAQSPPAPTAADHPAPWHGPGPQQPGGDSAVNT